MSTTTTIPELSAVERTDSRTPLILAGSLSLVMILVLRGMGRIWWCACGSATPLTLQAWGPHNSQHLIDPYIFSHLLHGVIFFFLFNWGPMRAGSLWGLLCATVLEAGWEIFENTPFTIDRYRLATAAIGYSGDSVLNSLGDLLACIGGWFLARKIGLAKSIILYAVLEIGCALWIRDNLTLNVLMILHPVEAIKVWQSGAI
jgi:hypothetical protein